MSTSSVSERQEDYVTSASLVARVQDDTQSQGGAVYIVMGTTGEYSDRKEWPVAAYLSEEDAQAHVLRATRWLERNYNQYDRDFDRWAWLETKPNPHDPDMDIDYTGASWFFYGPIPLHSVSDEHSQSEDAQAAECEACQRGGEAETPFPTSPLNEGARTPDTKPVAYLIKHPDYDNGLDFGELTEADRRAGYSSEPLYPASAVTTLLTNLAKAQRERRQALDLAERHMNEKHKIQAQAKEDWDLLQSRLSHLQTRLEEVEGALTDVPRFLTSVAWACARIGMSEQLKPEECKSHRADLFEMRDSVQRVRNQIVAALQPKGGDDAREFDLAIRARMHAFLDVDPTNGPCKCDVPVTDARRPTHCHLCGHLKRAALQPKGESHDQ